MKNDIYPLIKKDLQSDDNKETFALPKEFQPVIRPWQADLAVVYAYDDGKIFKLLQKKDIPKSYSIDKIHSIALDNLRHYLSNHLDRHYLQYGGMAYTCGGNFEASLILLPEIWDELQEHIEGSIVFIIPAQDVFLAMPADPVAVEALKQVIRDLKQNNVTFLSTDLYLYDNGSITIFEKFSP